jgi:hypothetical protein
MQVAQLHSTSNKTPLEETTLSNPFSVESEFIFFLFYFYCPRLRTLRTLRCYARSYAPTHAIITNHYHSLPIITMTIAGTMEQWNNGTATQVQRQQGYFILFV